MPFNLLLLPLLGGFIFARQWKKTRYYALRSDGHVLLFYAASCGAIILMFAAVLCFLLAEVCQYLDYCWHCVVPFEHSGKAALAFIIAATVWYPLNWFHKDEKEIDRVIQRKQDSLELLLRTAMGERKLVLLTVKNGKLYVGYIISNLNPAFPMETLGMIPMMSGYRDDETKTAKFTTLYTEAYDKIQRDIEIRVRQEVLAAQINEEQLEERIRDAVDEELDDFKIVIPVTEIQSASIFKLDTYNKYFRVESNLVKPS